MSFKSRGRYEVLQAQKFGVEIEEADPTDANLQKMYELMRVTSTRNKFYIRDSKFSMAYWKVFAIAASSLLPFLFFISMKRLPAGNSPKLVTMMSASLSIGTMSV